MLLFRHYLLAAVTVILLYWPINYLLSWIIYKRRVARITKNLPMVDDYPFFGMGPRFMRKNNEEIMDALRDLLFGNKTPFIGWLGPKSFIFIDHPKDIQTVMTSKGCIEKSDIYKFFNRGVGLFAAPAHIWKPQRKQLAASFNNQITWSFLPIFNEKANLLVRNIGRHVDKGDFDVMHYASACTLDIVCETVLGSHMKIQDGENADYMLALTEWLSAIARRMVNVFLHPDFIYKLTETYRIEADWLARSEIMPEKVITQKIIAFNSGNNNDLPLSEDDDEDRPIEKPQIFIDRLLQLNSKGLVSDQEIRDQVHLVIFGGHDTSSFTIAMAIFLLTTHPKIEQRVMDELNEVLGDQPIDADLTMEQVNRLIYLEQVVKETLRVYPVAPVLLRHASEDTKLDDFTVPAGSEVLISAITAHRRKDIWGEDADEFNPDHFSKEASADRNPYSFMAFSGGPRNCLGQRFAFISIKIILAKLFRKYQFSTNWGLEDIKFRLEVTIKPTNGIIVQVQHRT